MDERARAAPERDKLAASLRAGFGAIIREADEWRPIAQYVTDAVEQAVKEMEERYDARLYISASENDQLRSSMDNARKEVKEQAEEIARQDGVRMSQIAYQKLLMTTISEHTKEIARLREKASMFLQGAAEDKAEAVRAERERLAERIDEHCNRTGGTRWFREFAEALRAAGEAS